MRSRRLLVMLAVASAFSGSVRAADVTQISCPLTRLSPTGRADLAALAAGLGSYEHPAMLVFDAAVAKCASDLGWSEDEREAARRFGLSSLGHEELRRTLSGDGIDVALMEQAILADRELASAMRSPAFSREDVQAFLRRNLIVVTRAAGAHAANEELMGRVGVFLAMRAFVEAARHRFVAQ
jgi:hypothetical protein